MSLPGPRGPILGEAFLVAVPFDEPFVEFLELALIGGVFDFVGRCLGLGCVFGGGAGIFLRVVV